MGVVLLGGMLATAAVEDLREPQPTSPSVANWIWSRPVPTMNPERQISEQDCTKPIELSGNLRCR